MKVALKTFIANMLNKLT